jgi:hypothetical protein
MAVKRWAMAVPARRPDPLAGSVDVAGRTWHEVPGYGLVNWPIGQITEQARYLFALHRPGHARMRARIAWGVLPMITWPARYCKVCQTKWLCRAGAWAHDWLRTMAAAERNRIETAP